MSLSDIETEFGERPKIAMAHSEPLQVHHFRGQLDNNTKFVYCPIGFIISWSGGDYDHKWCHWCKKFFDEIEATR
jgi:hypothetical protein